MQWRRYAVMVGARYNDDNTPRHVEWEGTCITGVCAICHSSKINFVRVSPCNDGRVCVDERFQYAPAGVLSFSFYWVRHSYRTNRVTTTTAMAASTTTTTTNECPFDRSIGCLFRTIRC